jgi:two-component system, sensor histidine kinase RpfC
MTPENPVIRRVLVVDDNQLVARSLLTLLRDEGYDPFVFQAGQPALDFSRDNCLDAALIDIHLPDLSGLEVTRQLRQTHGKDLPIILFSGDSSIETLRALPDAGATYFLSKPVNVTRLLECLKDWTTPMTKTE